MNRTLVLFFALWVLYGVALLSRVFFAADSAILESIQRYAFIAGLGALVAHFGRRWIALVPALFTVALCVVIGTVGEDWPLAGKLLGAFLAAWAIGSAIRGSSAASR